MRVALTIAGSDPSGGAGLQADLKTFHHHRCYGASVVTLLTVQNTRSVQQVRILDADFLVSQLKAVLDDIPPHAAKTGALGSAENVDALISRASRFDFPLVVDPVMVSKHGNALIEREAFELIQRKLLPLTYLVTPNLPEAEILSERNIESVMQMERAAQSIAKLGAKHVLIKGGHLKEEATDVLWSDGQIHRFPARRIESPHTHGTGCVYSAAITARLAYHEGAAEAVGRAKQFLVKAIESAPGLGSGFGPINMHAEIVPLSLPAKRRT